jgi:5-methylcytosine-specific restriction endonuclease McrA
MIWQNGVRRGGATQSKEADLPRKRQPSAIWLDTRQAVWERDGGRCVHCGAPVTLEECNIDHIRSGKLGTNHQSNLRTLCRRCHVLRADIRHQGMIVKALEDGIIPPNWRELVWEDRDLKMD